MVGRSLLRPLTHTPVLALSNCSGVWGCAFENWGVMHESHKLHAREWDADWLCYDVARDPDELAPLPLSEPSCAALRAEAERIYEHLPGKGP